MMQTFASQRYKPYSIFTANFAAGTTQETDMSTENLPYAVYATAFHGGRLISRHPTLEAAQKASAKWRMSGCMCGCAGVVGPGQEPGTQAQQRTYSDPYAVGAI